MFEDLPAVCALAKHANVAVKASGMPSLSQERYPFRLRVARLAAPQVRDNDDPPAPLALVYPRVDVDHRAQAR